MFRDDIRPRERLLPSQRRKIFDKTFEKVTKEYFDPNFNGTGWPRLAREARQQILEHENPAEFELAMHNLVRKLGTSHTGFFHRSVKRVPARLAIGATLNRAEIDVGRSWVIQDVHAGGPAHSAGVRPLDALLSIGGRAVKPDEQPMFPMGVETPIRVRRGSDELTLTVSVPRPRSRKQPYAEPNAVSWKLLRDDLGYLKVAILPGLLGLDVAREIDRAVAQLSSCERLILDLRGHLGGGLGVLRLMSHLAPGRLPIGYTVTRRRAELGYDKAKLPILDRLPTHLLNPLAIAEMAFRFAGRDPSVTLISEGLGAKPWHGKVAILVNEHTASAGEMVTAFAAENNLAKLVGTETAGRLIPGSGFDVGYGYMLIMPKAEYVTWQGQRFEGRGVIPDKEALWRSDRIDADGDGHLARSSTSNRRVKGFGIP